MNSDETEIMQQQKNPIKLVDLILRSSFDANM